jgi:lysophospholipid acyltransferase (LPLAT)-like uncharacterized protein
VGATSTPDTVPTSAPPPVFTLKQQVALWLITWSVYLIVRAIGPTLRFAVSREEGAPEPSDSGPFVYSFWHSCMLPAMYLYRDLKVRVMSSDSFDGEFTGRIIRKFGFVKVRGSSSRGAVRALIGMKRELDRGWTVAFTIDGPRGPKYVVKPGPVALSKMTGAPMMAFHIALDRAWVLNTWDSLMIPKPFARALIRISRTMPVPQDATDVEMGRCQAELQAALDRARQFSEANVHKAGGQEFPFLDQRLGTNSQPILSKASP